MPTNDFLPFAISGGAPVLNQAAYVAATPANGRGAGILPKEYYNKVARQSSVMAAAIGLFLNNNGQDALDNGDIPALAAKFAAALGGANSAAFFSLRTAAGAAGSRTISLVPGTYTCSLHSFYSLIDDVYPGRNYDLTATQSGIIAGDASLTLNTSARIYRGGGDGYGRQIYSNDLAVGTLVATTAHAYTLTVTGAVTGAAAYVGRGSILTCERVG